MRVYVAAKFEEGALVRQAHARLRAAGHTVTLDWTALPVGDRHFGANAVRDLAGVLSADAVLLYPHDRGKGLFVELGAALAAAIPVVAVVSRLEDEHPLFLYHPTVRLVTHLEAALLELGEIEADATDEVAS